MSQTSEALDKAWRSTCRMLFGQETCALSDAALWLGNWLEKRRGERSFLSGKPVRLSLPFYSRQANFLSFDEVDFGKKFEPLTINEMKDIDSIALAISERSSYVGNIILGNSTSVESSSGVVESHFVLDSISVFDSKYIAYSDYVRRSQYCFGALGLDKSEYSARCMGAWITRCFECPNVSNTTDSYYCTKTYNCRDCMFCFGVENGSYVIGNTRLPKDKYLSIKASLTAQIAQAISKDGKIFSVFDIVEKCNDRHSAKQWSFPASNETPFDIAPIEKAFSQTTSLIFGKPFQNLQSYHGFLQKHIPENVALKSAVSASEVLACSYRAHLLSIYDLKKRMAREDEIRFMAKDSDGLVRPESLRIDLEELAKMLSQVAYCNLDRMIGNVQNVSNATVLIDAQDCYCGSAFTFCKKCSHCYWASVSEAIFGSYCVFDSSFCAKCYNSKKMTRAFECDTCEDCADAYFLHNCENVRDSMFCFNAKNLSHAVGNAPLPAEQYGKIKSGIAAQIADELERKKDLKWDIFNLGAKK